MEGRHLLTKGLAICAGLAAILAIGLTSAHAAQVQLGGNKIPQFVDPLPLMDVQGGPMKTAIAKPLSNVSSFELHMREFKANMMPSTFVPAVGTYTGTTVWGYRQEPTSTVLPTQGTYLGPVFVTTRGTPTTVNYVNDLGNTGSTLLQFWRTAIDQTLHWADPLNGQMNMCAHSITLGTAASGTCAINYQGPIPAVPHLHGGEVPPVMDGGPNAWFTSDGAYHGNGFYSRDGNTSGNYAIYRYPNSQQASPIWFHDHLLGGTRLNVYAGLAGAYVIEDPTNPPPGDLGDPTKIIPLVIQDRMFDTMGELFFPSVGINVEHPFWVPEFIGDTICVNGKVWPFLNVETGKRYRFLIVEGSNARSYELFIQNSAGSAPPIWQIETDGGYLDSPVKIDPAAKKGALQKLFIMPGERAGIIIDFTGVKAGTTLTLRNTAPAPFPMGAPPNGGTTGSIMQFRVMAAGTTTTPSVTFDPSVAGANLRPTDPIVRLVNNATGAVAAGVTVAKTRVLTLNEAHSAGGPIEILVNNTQWDGRRGDATRTIPTGFVPVTIGGLTEYYSELPAEGTTEVWEIVNLTADAHPIHTHLTQFQIINRQNLDAKGYGAAYAALFPGGQYFGATFLPGTWIPAWGPPLPYFPADQTAAQLVTSAGKFGGNPDPDAAGPKGPLYLMGPVILPDANEQGWKDTIHAFPGTVTRIAIRYAPMEKPIADPNLSYPFDPQALGYGFVWHCHIVDHEDNEMMRSLQVQQNGATRTYIQGIDY